MKKILLAMLVVSASLTVQAKVLVTINSFQEQELKPTNMSIYGGSLTIETKTEKYEITQQSLEYTGISGKELIDLISNYSNQKTKNLHLVFSANTAYGRTLLGLSSVSVK